MQTKSDKPLKRVDEFSSEFQRNTRLKPLNPKENKNWRAKFDEDLDGDDEDLEEDDDDFDKVEIEEQDDVEEEDFNLDEDLSDPDFADDDDDEEEFFDDSDF